MDTPTPPSTPPEDSRPGSATMLTISAADLGELIGDQAACATFAQSALVAVAHLLEKVAEDCKGDEPPKPRTIAAALAAARDALNAPGLLTERAANGLKSVEAAICEAARNVEGKPMPPPGAALLDKLTEAMPNNPKPGQLAPAIIKTLQGKAISLAIAAAPRAEPPPFTGRNGKAWGGSPWNPDAQNN